MPKPPHIFKAIIPRLFTFGKRKDNKVIPEGNKASIKRYKEANIKEVRIQLNRRTESDILDYLEMQPNKNGYIKALIRADMAAHKS